ncbi:acetolactate synthase large subunit [Mycobacterium sp. 21AC1]|uniref:acetolactate synthase large subunit n=1 Tax=[Mycobacterium] appelbergii TaxID=2939269 RepID=UPI0029391EBD|nr:acetolactate synthase large subunit [Mycobacterium sp. 21AC1]MDV3128024.1 acetolactate synthase large subunit [Mycobacterium sp. 21AC1]
MSTGAQVVVQRLLAEGVEVCFANPGTSEMHFVAALDAVGESGRSMRPVLCLFEGVATGAADGYARIAGTPAATLLHLGPGMANGLANLHNARRAHSPVVNIVGDHATYHKSLDAPLESDIDALGGWLCGSVHRPAGAADLDAVVRDAVRSAAGPPGQVATVILPADFSWGTTAQRALPQARTGSAPAGDIDVTGAAEMLRSHGDKALFLLGGASTTPAGLGAVARICAATGARALIETFPARLARGRGVPAIERLAYLAEQATQQLSGITQLILVGASAPVSFFAYPGKPSELVPEGAQVHTLAVTDLHALDDEVGGALPPTTDPGPADLPKGPLTPQNWAMVVGALLPENAIISDEANTSGVFLPTATATAPPHDVLTLTGGAIGQGLPVAVGAAVAAPHRPVIALQSDGSAAYTISALWTMAREHLDITVVILNNHAYAILQMELQRVGTAATGDRSRSLLDLSHPDIDFAAIAQGFGVPATRAFTAEELAEQFRAAVSEPGPHLIDAAVPAWSVG